MGVSTLYVNNPGLQKLQFFTVDSNSLYLYIYRVLKHFVTEPKMLSDLQAANERAALRQVTNERPGYRGLAGPSECISVTVCSLSLSLSPPPTHQMMRRSRPTSASGLTATAAELSYNRVTTTTLSSHREATPTTAVRTA